MDTKDQKIVKDLAKIVGIKSFLNADNGDDKGVFDKKGKHWMQEKVGNSYVHQFINSKLRNVPPLDPKKYMFIRGPHSNSIGEKVQYSIGGGFKDVEHVTTGQWSLTGIAYHSGPSGSYGHWYSYVKRDGQIYECNDATTKKKNDWFPGGGDQQPSLFLFEKVGTKGGRSRNKRTRRKHTSKKNNTRKNR